MEATAVGQDTRFADVDGLSGDRSEEKRVEGIEDGKNAWAGVDAPSVCGTLCWQLPTGRE